MKNQYEGKHSGAQASTPKNTGKVHKPGSIGGAAKDGSAKRKEKNGA